MADRHKAAAITFRPAETDDEWLRQRAAEAGETINALLRRIVTDARAASEHPKEISR
jgi:hypothetical protein